ncbi:MAG: peptide chain release factor H [Kordia sp.]|nr:MAG: peptide chain release factor H [Kordia sp.]
MDKIIQITAARGPAECCWVVAQVLKVFIAEVKAKGIEYIILQREKGIENGTVQSVSIQLSGTDVNSFLTTWTGTVQWVGTSAFRKYHKRKNWFIGVYELEQLSLSELNEKDISFQTMRSTGPGGQNVNKVNSAVRAIHTPTGVQVVAMDSRSQHQNKKLAITRLKEKVMEANRQQLKTMELNLWKNHLSLERGNPIRVFNGTDFKKKKVIASYKNNRNQLKNDLRKELKN